MATDSPPYANKRKLQQTLDLEGRVPPQNLDAERSLLGCILLWSESLDEVGEIIHVDHFYSDAHQKIFKAAQALYEKGNKGIDVVTVAEVLESNSQLEEIGGVPYLAQIMDTVPHAAHARYYAKIVREKWLQRNLIYTCTEVLRDSYESAVPVDEIMSQAESRLFQIFEAQNLTEKLDLKEILMDAWDRINERMNQIGTVTGLRTGLNDFDKKTSGFQPTELIIIAARPSMGKTALVCNFAEGFARLNSERNEQGEIVRNKGGVLLFSLEQSNLELAERLMCIRAAVDGTAVRSGEIRDDAPAREKLLKAINQLSELPILIDDQAGRNIMQINTIARRTKRRMPQSHGCELGVVIIDYLQLIEPEDKRVPREQQIAAISRRLKFMAKELNIPVIALSQLNRGVEMREDKRPKLSDLRESGAIEQDADMIMFLHRPEQYDPADRPGEADIIIAKHRSGPTGIVTTTFRKQFMRFADHTYQDVPSNVFPTDLEISHFEPPPDIHSADLNQKY
ncbi:MAG TPA: replicative DNA helicase [Planctomycetaceae bacterium]|nr:replicative DNA helicase [Planctomycetaceae bacterium]